MAKKVGSKQKKMNARVDFTPMVDMIMLLVTFFMLCTTLLKPQTMELALPSDKQDLKDEQRNQAKASEAVTILVGANNKLFYFEGKPEEAKANLQEVAYGREGIRAFLMQKNAKAQGKVAELKKKYSTIEVNDANKKKYNEELSKIKSGEGTPTVVIKISDKASYENMMAVLDEMNICSIGKYVMDNFLKTDAELIGEPFEEDPNAAGAEAPAEM